MLEQLDIQKQKEWLLMQTSHHMPKLIQNESWNQKVKLKTIKLLEDNIVLYEDFLDMTPKF